MKLLAIWILMSAVTYWFTKYSRFGKNVFQHDLKAEGTGGDVIAVFCAMFAIAWPLWWLLMFPVCICIGRKEPSRTNLVRNYTKHLCDRLNAEALPGNVAKMWDVLERIKKFVEGPCEIANDDARAILDNIDVALASPPRNCDAGTAEEQEERFNAFCERMGRCKRCRDCTSLEGRGTNDPWRCLIEWMQMPYEAEKEEGNNGSK